MQSHTDVSASDTNELIITRAEREILLPRHFRRRIVHNHRNAVTAIITLIHYPGTRQPRYKQMYDTHNAQNATKFMSSITTQNTERQNYLGLQYG